MALHKDTDLVNRTIENTTDHEQDIVFALLAVTGSIFPITIIYVTPYPRGMLFLSSNVV